jgi:hypothetical protein
MKAGRELPASASGFTIFLDGPFLDVLFHAFLLSPSRVFPNTFLFPRIANFCANHRTGFVGARLSRGGSLEEGGERQLVDLRYKPMARCSFRSDTSVLRMGDTSIRDRNRFPLQHPGNSMRMFPE